MAHTWIRHLNLRIESGRDIGGRSNHRCIVPLHEIMPKDGKTSRLLIQFSCLVGRMLYGLWLIYVHEYPTPCV